MRRLCSWGFLLSLCGLVGTTSAQDQLPKHPNYAKYQEAARQVREIATDLAKGNPVGWATSDTLLMLPGNMAFNPRTGETKEYDTQTANRAGGGRRPGGAPARGRQFTSTTSPDGKKVARFENQNVILEVDGVKTPVTTDGSVTNRIKYGTASWVYGEELGQRDAMWWTADSQKLVYYRFDESQVKDYFVTLRQNAVQNQLYTEAYPKAGAPNPTVELHCYDLATRQSFQVDTTFPGADPDVAHYVYNIRFAPDGKTLLFHRTNRKQNVMELCAVDLSSRQSRVLISETNPNGWVENTPRNYWLTSGRQMIWMSERSGFWNLYLADLEKGVTSTITNHEFEVGQVLKVDEKRQEIWYTAHSAKNPYLMQLHRIDFAGKRSLQLTNPKEGHQVQISEDGEYFVSRHGTIDQPLSTSVFDRNGKLVKKLHEPAADVLKGFQRTRRFVAKAADGMTDLYGYYRLPKDFDETKEYPLLVRVYAGPDSGSGQETFIGPDPVCELGVITAWIDGRGTNGRGRAFRQAPYRRLGIVEIDDQAAAVKELKKLAFVSDTEVGIEGTSYGGYASCMALLRHPDVFSAACASSSVTAWDHYDSIYTERFMDTPQNNPSGYADGSAMKYAAQLKGDLCLFYGTADDNVHPSNTHQLIAALDAAAKPYRLYVGVDQGHAGLRFDRMMEFFLRSWNLL